MMTDRTPPTALIAEDEPLLANALKKALALAWPELQLVAMVGDGQSAVSQALALMPDVLFLDIRMPGLSGLEAAADIADGWEATGPAAAKPFPALVFVTAYDQYAVQAFEARAVDYLLKPLQEARLRQTVARLQQALASRAAPEPGRAGAATAGNPALEQAVEQLRQLMSAPPAAAASLSVLQASVGNVIHVIPVDEVLLLEAADKYVRVLTAQHEYLIRTPLRELLPQLDGNQFWQIHRAHAVRVQAIDTVTRDEAGKLWLQLRGRPERLAVSRLHAHLFKAM